MPIHPIKFLSQDESVELMVGSEALQCDTTSFVMAQESAPKVNQKDMPSVSSNQNSSDLNANKHQCPQCQKVFPSKSRLEKHLGEYKDL